MELQILTATIVNAIRGRKRLRIYYAPGWRTVEPHTIGQSADGNILLRAYQVEGASASGEHEHWKLFRVDRLTECGDDGSDFDGPRPEYKKGDKAMKGGIIQEL